MRIGRVASATEPPNCEQVSKHANDHLERSSHFEVIGDVVIFASWGTKHRITGLRLI